MQAIALLIEQFHHVTQQQAAVDALVARISVRKVETDVPQGSSTQQGITQRMDGDIGIAVTQQASLPWNIHAA